MCHYRSLTVAFFLLSATSSLFPLGSGRRCSLSKQEDLVSSIAAPPGCFDAWRYSVSYPDQVLDYFATVCDPLCRRALHRFQLECGGNASREALDGLRHTCAVNEDSSPCYRLAVEESTVFYGAYEKCWNVNEVGLRCTDQCQQALEEFGLTHGCCANALYNSSPAAIGPELEHFVYDLPDAGVMDYGLWAKCGVKAPPTCRSEAGRLMVISNGGQGVSPGDAAAVCVTALASTMVTALAIYAITFFFKT